MRPNIVLILADDMGYGDFAFVNGGLSSTPALDQLASDGTVFGQHYSASPVCAPARAALLTGRYPQRTGVIDTLEARGTDRLALRETTLADALRAGGYRTGLVGKWHAGAIGEGYHPLHRGFDEFTGFRGGWQDYWDWTIESAGRRMPSDGRYLTDVFTDEAVDFIRRSAATPREPFFLHVAYNAPHFPLQAPEEVIARHRRDGRTEAVALVYAMIEVMDRGVAAIRQALDDTGLLDNTLLIFTSDNGPDLGGVGPLSARRFNAGLAGEKQHVLEGGIRLPLIAHWPDGMPAPRRSHAFVHFTDWYPTLLDVAGVQRPDGLPLDGVSIAASLTGEAHQSDRPRFWQWTRYRPMLHSNAAMRDGRWKLVRPATPGTLDHNEDDQRIDADIKAHPDRYPEPIDAPPPWQPVPDAHRPALYDLEADPGETTDLADRHPRIVNTMETELTRWFESVERDRKLINESTTR